jgi:AAA15 family ATPase/GTPase
MGEHFLQWIKIIDFKCFHNFEAKDFKRVNLISGKNNVGKTAFMEACLRSNNNDIIPINKHNWNYGSTNLSKYRENKYFYQIYKKNNPPQISNSTFITPCAIDHSNLKEMIDTLKMNGKYDTVNSIFNDIFNIEKIDVIKNKVMLQQNAVFRDINYYGDGLKHFLNILLALMANKNNVVYLDEIENGIHYTLFEKLWELILNISKEVNCQVFATTHSKECIESYLRVAKKLEEKEITSIRISRLKDGSLIAGVRDFDLLNNTISQEHEVR